MNDTFCNYCLRSLECLCRLLYLLVGPGLVEGEFLDPEDDIETDLLEVDFVFVDLDVDNLDCGVLDLE